MNSTIVKLSSFQDTSMARKFNKCLTEGVVSYIAVEGLACDHHVSYVGQR